MSFNCSTCGRPIYNRRRKTCEFCGVALPGHLLLTARQKDVLDRLKADETKQHREFMARNPSPADDSGLNFPLDFGD